MDFLTSASFMLKLCNWETEKCWNPVLLRIIVVVKGAKKFANKKGTYAINFRAVRQKDII